jgi:hypothetical protein
MASESGDNKLIGNFRKLIDQVSAEPAYNPANIKLKVTALETQYSAADAAAASVAAARAPHTLAITDRETAFKDMRRLAVRSRNFLKASGAPKGVLDDAETSLRKLRGGRASTKAKAGTTPSGTAGQQTDTNGGSSSASQMSYDNQVGNFEQYIEILKNVPTYNPNEADLKVTALTARAGSLTAKNNTVNTTLVTLSQARGQRDMLLYVGDDSIIITAQLVKAYVKAALGTQSQVYKQIKGLQFGK